MWWCVEREKLAQRVSFFVNSEKELAELESSDKHIVIVGYRRLGKTHLIIKHLLKTWRKKTIPVYVDMLYYSSWEEFTESLVEKFLVSYDEASGERLSSFFTRIFSSLSSILSSVKEIKAKLGVEGVNLFFLQVGL